MYYFILFFGVIALLSLVAFAAPSRPMVAFQGIGPGRNTGRAHPGGERPGAAGGGMLQWKRKEDKPCLTVIECVQDGKCAGHCGHH